MLNAICGTRGGVVTTPESRIDFDNFVLWALDPFLLAFAGDGFLRTLQREKYRDIFKAVTEEEQQQQQQVMQILNAMVRLQIDIWLTEFYWNSA